LKDRTRPQLRGLASALHKQPQVLDRLTSKRDDDRRVRAELARQEQPWRHSTGPRTTAGKAQSSRNAWKGGVRPQLRILAKALREQAKGLDHLRSDGDDDD
jgi:hypothetical protein